MLDLLNGLGGVIALNLLICALSTVMMSTSAVVGAIGIIVAATVTGGCPSVVGVGAVGKGFGVYIGIGFYLGLDRSFLVL